MKKIVSLITLFFLMLLPINAYAVEFSITNVQIDAYLQENGDVHVRETHTYDFDSKFNGITREIIPKKGAEISDFMAKEKEKTLNVEKDGHLYKIYRQGKNETVVVDLQYVIKNGLEKHADMTEFYWPFFDQRNEANYENMMIRVHPPTTTNDVIAFGYDTAFNKQSVESGGTAQFALGYVSAGENGDIRVAYDSALFPSMTTTSSENIRQLLLDEKQTMEEKAEKYIENQGKFSNFMKIILPITIGFYFILFIIERLQGRRLRILVEGELTKNRRIVPYSKISMPATILHTKSITSMSISAALLDLVRLGYVEQLSEEEFIIVNSNVRHKHEKILIEWLFYEVGEKGHFQTKDLDKYIENKNLEKYNLKINEWKRAIKEELDQAGVKQSKTFVRSILGLIGLGYSLLIGISIYYDLPLMMVASLGIFIIGVSTAIFYRPMSFDGILISEEWKLLMANMNVYTSSDWEKATEDDRMRAIIYQLGVDPPQGKVKTEQWQQEMVGVDNTFFSYYLFTGPLLIAGFQQADKRYNDSITSNSTSSIGGSGGGVGGGGGGSGAF